MIVLDFKNWMVWSLQIWFAIVIIAPFIFAIASNLPNLDRFQGEEPKWIDEETYQKERMEFDPEDFKNFSKYSRKEMDRALAAIEKAFGNVGIRPSGRKP